MPFLHHKKHRLKDLKEIHQDMKLDVKLGSFFSCLLVSQRPQVDTIHHVHQTVFISLPLITDVYIQ